MKIEALLHEEIERQFNILEGLEVGSNEYKIAMDGLTKLLDAEHERNKFEDELQDKIDAREAENDIKTMQINDDKKDRRVKNILTALGITIPAGLTIWGTLKTLKFEETGTILTSAGRNFVSRLFKK